MLADCTIKIIKSQITTIGTSSCTCSSFVLVKMEKPAVDVHGVIKNVYGFDVESVKRLSSYDDMNFFVQCTTNTKHHEKFVLKVINCDDSEKEGLTETVANILEQLSTKKFPSPAPILTRKNELISYIDTADRVRKVVLLTYIDGVEIKHLNIENKAFMNLCHEAGVLCGNLDAKLQKIESKPGVLIRTSIWRVENIRLLQGKLNNSLDSHIMEICRSTINILSKLCAEDTYSNISKGIIHGDFALDNLVYKKITTENTYRIAGVIDFSDVSVSAYVFEIAVLLASTMHEAVVRNFEPCEAAKVVLTGFRSQFRLNPPDLGILFHAVLGRLCLLRVVCGEDILKNKETALHITSDISIVESLMKLMYKIGKENWNQRIF